MAVQINKDNESQYKDFIFNAKYNEIKSKFNDLNLDELKTICRESDIIGFSTLNKQPLIDLILKAYNARRTILSRNFNYDELKKMCIQHKLIKDDDVKIPLIKIVPGEIPAILVPNGKLIYPF